MRKFQRHATSQQQQLLIKKGHKRLNMDHGKDALEENDVNE